MANYPQNKFSAPNIAGKWSYWGNFQLFNNDGTIGPINTHKGIIDISQTNLFISYKNNEYNHIRLGVISFDKSSCQWVIDSVNNNENFTLHYTPYCCKNGKPTKMISIGTCSGPITPGTTLNPGVSTNYYLKL